MRRFAPQTRTTRRHCPRRRVRACRCSRPGASSPARRSAAGPRVRCRTSLKVRARSTTCGGAGCGAECHGSRDDPTGSERTFEIEVEPSPIHEPGAARRVSVGSPPIRLWASRRCSCRRSVAWLRRRLRRSHTDAFAQLGGSAGWWLGEALGPPLGRDEAGGRSPARRTQPFRRPPRRLLMVLLPAAGPAFVSGTPPDRHAPLFRVEQNCGPTVLPWLVSPDPRTDSTPCRGPPGRASIDVSSTRGLGRRLASHGCFARRERRTQCPPRPQFLLRRRLRPHR